MEIYTGIDIVENQRIEKVIKKFGNKFLKRVFTEEEINYCMKQKNYIPCLSARFACKEACIKAFYQAFGKVLTFKQIEVKGEKGKPAEILLHPEKNKKLLLSKSYKSSVSISHEKDFSVAIVLVYRL